MHYTARNATILLHAVDFTALVTTGKQFAGNLSISSSCKILPVFEIKLEQLDVCTLVATCCWLTINLQHASLWLTINLQQMRLQQLNKQTSCSLLLKLLDKLLQICFQQTVESHGNASWYRLVIKPVAIRCQQTCCNLCVSG